jgi:hypothetical protein
VQLNLGAQPSAKTLDRYKATANLYKCVAFTTAAAMQLLQTRSQIISSCTPSSLLCMLPLKLLLLLLLPLLKLQPCQAEDSNHMYINNATC